ncbi:MAG TPA: protein kinase, partial [Ktedonobacteraceae bacterium]|nr:protein kinase [Ktedonobacteraceae bacterium]
MTRDLIEQQLGKYQLVSLLGHSGFAEIYLGEHVQFSTRAAIKVLHAHLSSAKIKAFEQEAKMIATLVHPHIASILDFGVSNGIPFLVMDYCPHGSLRKRHAKGERIPLLTVISYVKQIADALQYAHNQKHIHHNVKPENMFIGQHDDILLSDFGIAATAHNTFFMSRQAFVGTPPYMAPEQIKLHRRRESDQYALAIATYEWLAGKLPFLGTPEEIATKHLSVEPPSLCQKLPNLPVSVEAVVFKALAKERNERFPSVQDFADALEEASQTKPLVFVPPPQPNTAPPQPTQPPVAVVPTPPAVMPAQASTKEVDTPDVQPPTMGTAITQTNTPAKELDPSTTAIVDTDSLTQPRLTAITVVADTNFHVQPQPPTDTTVVDTNALAKEPDSSTLTPIADTNSHAEPQPATVAPIAETNEPSRKKQGSKRRKKATVADTNSHVQPQPPTDTTIVDTNAPAKESDSSTLIPVPDTNSHVQPQLLTGTSLADTNTLAKEPDSSVPDTNSHVQPQL